MTDTSKTQAQLIEEQEALHQRMMELESRISQEIRNEQKRNSTEPNAFSQDHIEILQDMTQILAEGSARMEDFRTLEQRNQELEREVTERRWMEEALQQAHSELEKRIEERTAELRTTHEQLQQEITECKQAEEALRASETCHRTLVKETHHRVRNHLQTLLSLLDLHALQMRERPLLQLFKDCRSRVQSMASLHESLYQSPDLRRIDFSEYIRSLVPDLFSSYEIHPEVIRLKLQLETLVLDMDAAVPGGLILHELVANALQHAFPAGRKGEIGICLRREEPDQVTLQVWDNGVGFPQEVDFRNPKSLGLKLVVRLVNQLKGTIDLHTQNGTEFTVHFGI